jgi:hypothetical protein
VIHGLTPRSHPCHIGFEPFYDPPVRGEINSADPRTIRWLDAVEGLPLVFASMVGSATNMPSGRRRSAGRVDAERESHRVGRVLDEVANIAPKT